MTGVHEEGDDFYQDIEMLQSHGINVADIKKLKSPEFVPSEEFR